MPPPPTDKQNRGQILHRNGDYSGALEIFSTILDKWLDKANPPMSVLDNRVATLIRLKRYDDALKDARTMIKADKTSASGFIHAGQILEKQGNYERAIEVYQYGLKFGADRAAIKELKHGLVQAQRHIIPEKAKDWMMTTLPIEVLEMIISLLPLKDMVRLLQVCRVWKTVLSRTPRLWKDLNFGTSPALNVKYKTLEVYAQRAQWKVRKLVLPNAARGSIRMLVNKCRTLTILRLGHRTAHQEEFTCLLSLMGAKNLQDIRLINYPMAFSQVFDLIHALPSLTRLSASIVSRRDDLLNLADAHIPARMKSIHFEGHRCNCEYYLGDLLASARDLESLRLSSILDGEFRLDHLDRLKDVSLLLHASTGPIRFPPSIEEILLQYQAETATAAAFLNDIQAGSLTKLKNLTVREGEDGIRLLELLHQCGSQLEELALSSYGDEILNHFWMPLKEGHFSKLKWLRLSEIDMCDDNLELIGQKCPGLNHLGLFGIPDITGSGIRLLIEANPQLKHLIMNNCDDVSTDTIFWARSRGIIVDYNL